MQIILVVSLIIIVHAFVKGNYYAGKLRIDVQDNIREPVTATEKTFELASKQDKYPLVGKHLN